ncbi:MAG TPA: hypothetical protein VG960_11090 [Caulobacteraceae bacterium]|nr:hypothetical protein [Caulobacteraceae bacterium]
MAKGFAIAAFVFVLLSFPIPVLGNFITLGALALVTVAAFAGDSAWTVAVTVISGIKLFFLSPTWHLMMFGAATQRPSDELTRLGVMSQAQQQQEIASGQHINGVFLTITLLFLAAPIAAMVYRSATGTSATQTPEGTVS